MYFKGNGFDNRSGGKPQALKAFSDDIGALFIDVYEHYPNDSNGYLVDGNSSERMFDKCINENKEYFTIIYL